MKEILITKERSNEKFQEFRRMILENLGIVLKIICGDKFLTHKFDTNDYMDYKPKVVTKKEYAMNMVEKDLHEVYNIMTQGYTEVCNGGSIEKTDLTHKYNVCTLVSTETKIKNNTQEIKMKDGKEKMLRNVRVLEESVEKGLLQGYALESAKQTLDKIDHRTIGVDTWVLENNEGTYGTEIVITKEGHIDLYLCIMEKYASIVSYIRVGNFQPEFGLGDIWLPNGEIKEYQKLGTIINTLNKEYEKYGFYFTADTKNNRRILADARKSYELFIAEEKEKKRKEDVIEEITFDIDGESSLHITEKKDVDYATAQKEYRLRLQSAPEETYNKTNFDLKINGECVYGFRVDLCRGFDHKFELADELLRNLKFQKRVWSGEEYSWMQGEYREKRIKEQFGTEEEMIKFFDKIEEILVGFGTPEPTKSEEVIEVVAVEKMEEKEINTINKNALTNRMTKLGEFLKENRDKDIIENKVLELFPKATEVEVFEGDNVVHFLVGQEYVGKAPTKKEMKELDWEYRETIQTYGLTLYVAVESDKIKMDAHIAVDYRDRHGCSNNIDFTVKELEIELELTMEVAKELAEEIRNKHNNGELSPCYAWNRINDLTNRKTTDEVLDFLTSEKQYYDEKEQEEREQKNVEYVNKTINTSYQLFADGTISVDKVLQKLKRLEYFCHNYALLKKVEDARKLFERAEDRRWREVVRQEIVEMLEEKYNKVFQEKIDILKKEVTVETTVEDAKEILSKLGKNIKVEWDNDTFGFCVSTEPTMCEWYGVGDKDAVYNDDCEKIISTDFLQFGIEWSNASNTMIIYAKGRLEYMNHNGERSVDICHYPFHEVVECSPEPEETDELEKI